MREPLSAPDAAIRRFNLVQWVVAIIFVASVIAAAWIVRTVEADALRLAAPVLPAVALAWWAWAFISSVRASDEMLQASHARAIAIAAGLVLFAASVWGLFEYMVGAPEFPAFLLLPAFSAVYGVVLLLQRIRRS